MWPEEVRAGQAHASGGALTQAASPFLCAPAKYLRLKYVEYPDGRQVHYTYGTTGDTGDRLSRVERIVPEDDGSPDEPEPETDKHFAAYTYLGAGTVVKVAHPAVSGGLNLTYGTGGTYGGLDRFGRVVDQRWEDDTTPTPAVLDQFQYGYDRASNRIWRENALTHDDGNGNTPELDELYEYDGLHRLEKVERGRLTGNPYDDIVAGTEVVTQQWGLDALGNWAHYQVNNNPDEDSDFIDAGDLNQNRLHNLVNELDSDDDHLPDPIDPDAITEGGGQSAWVVPGYDAAGNMAFGPNPTRAGSLSGA